MMPLLFPQPMGHSIFSFSFSLQDGIIKFFSCISTILPLKMFKNMFCISPSHLYLHTTYISINIIIIIVIAGHVILGTVQLKTPAIHSPSPDSPRLLRPLNGDSSEKISLRSMTPIELDSTCRICGSIPRPRVIDSKVYTGI